MDNLKVLSYAAQHRRGEEIEFRKDRLAEQGLPHSDLGWAEVRRGLAGVEPACKKTGKTEGLRNEDKIVKK